MIVKKVDRENKFVSIFNTKTGQYMRTGVLDDNGRDTGVDPFMTNYPELIDVGVMGSCIHGMKGLCIKGGVECYQNGLGFKQPNMSVENFKSIVEESKGKVFQIALGGRGDVNKHENFGDILKSCIENEIVPNYTTSGLELTEQEIKLTKEHCGAVAVSWYRQQHTIDAINNFVNANVKTNIHYVLGNNSIDEAIERLEDNTFPKGINAIVFLLHKPVGLGSEKNVLKPDDERVVKFFNIIDNIKFDFKVGFDSCTVPAIINYTSKINKDSIDTCEGGRWSMYITSDMKALPCSFDNQDMRWAYDLKENNIKDAWDSDQFKDFRNHFENSCGGCSKRIDCMGGCPIRREIVLCQREEKNLYESKTRFCNQLK